MTDDSRDKRVLARRRSLNSIFDAFFELLQKQPLETITVSALIRRSGVARSTFYRHFSSVLDVSDGYFRFLDEAFDEETGGNVDLHARDYFIKVFTIYQRICDRLLIYEEAGLASRFLQSIAEHLINNLGDMPYSSPDRYELHYYAGAIYCVAREWIASGMKETPEEMADLLLNGGSARSGRSGGARPAATAPGVSRPQPVLARIPA
ncbi:MAG: TetR/AcrR family transcriptional regulator [Bifidobacteriaceae bacterium]|jgi:AcrR family transcriptional regulator|nr:TetR/AcrR family transcriptional regulator [Bifidobacteriaceae bacterium]